MLRRHAIPLLLAPALERLLPRERGAAVVLDARSGRVQARNGPDPGAAAPGSTVKPFVLAALLASGRLRADEALPCPGRLALAGRRFDCSHPRGAAAITVETALAYSCNAFVARVAERFEPGELARELARYGFTPGAAPLDALGEGGVRVTPLGLARAYRSLALRAAKWPRLLAGLEGAVEYGTARLARVDGVTMAGKTGTARGVAWFAGWTPSRAPERVIVVMLAGRSGGADAAPIAAEILRS